MKSLSELENTYSPGPDEPVPDLGALPGVAAVRLEPVVEQSAVYFDTEHLDLLRAGVTLRRRTGGHDEGWHLKVPSQAGSRLELHQPLDDAGAPPESLRELAAGWVRGATLVPVATIETRRSPTLLLDAEGNVLAEHVDDHVTGSAPDSAPVRWREWELEIVDGAPSLLEDADDLLAAGGVHRAEVSRKVAHVLGHRLPPATDRPTPRPGKAVSRLVHERLVTEVAALARYDVEARHGTEEGIHQMRVACRRLRAVLATYRPVLQREVTDPVRDEIRWLACVLGGARDAAVVHANLSRLVADENPALVHGPVLDRLHQTYAGKDLDALRATLGSQRYFALRTTLDALVVHAPWSELADEPAHDVVPRLLRKELRRFRATAAAAAQAEGSTVALHEVRKAAKRLRYAAESLQPVAGKPARRLAREATQITSVLGELQDTAVSRAELLDLARAAQADGEPGFTYGLLHGRLERRADELVASYRADDPLSRLATRTDAVIRELAL
ncbi:MAG: CYTH and CHAD domain-containing protein [Propionibacteriales bacterium]|nr:CYTH and CHAD domain-containing protein [Propionibacteriales bacterium]